MVKVRGAHTMIHATKNQMEFSEFRLMRSLANGSAFKRQHLRHLWSRIKISSINLGYKLFALPHEDNDEL
jgi:hypothetical protein